MKRLFIAGTDTGIGKTTLARALGHHLVSRGQRVAVMKPVSSGCDPSSEGLRNRDAEGLMADANVALPYEQVNPFAFEPPIAPHIAAAEAGVEVKLDPVVQTAEELEADWLIVEGVGGWQVPLGPTLMQSDLVAALECDVLLVAGIRLGCLNHTLLTADRIVADGFRLTGWVGNLLDQRTLRVDEQLDTLKSAIDAPFLGLSQPSFPPLPAALARQLDFSAISC